MSEKIYVGLNTELLSETVEILMKNAKGILAIDESPLSLEKKFMKYDLVNSIDTRKRYRECLITTEGLENYISGTILHEETFFQTRDADHKPFTEILLEKGILPGIKLDLGLERIDYSKCEHRTIKISDRDTHILEFQSEKNCHENYIEKVSKGIDSLKSRLIDNHFKRARFAKWRCIFSITQFTPTYESVDQNCDILAEYAYICQQHDIVPVVEPEILFTGDFSLYDHHRVSKIILSTLITKLNSYNVYMPGILLKTGFVTPGEVRNQVNPKENAIYTHDVLISSLPSSIGGIVFLSGGHSYSDSLHCLAEICKLPKNFNITFSYGRGLTDSALSRWNESHGDIKKVQKIFISTCLEMSRASVQSSDISKK